MLQSWMDRQATLTALAGRQLFFVAGAPRSGTTWLQHLLDAHPEVCCRGEGLFQQQVVKPLDAMVGLWRQALAEKNANIFRHSGGYKLPEDDDADQLIGTAILGALARQCGGQEFRAVGEKTPENVFLFPRLKRLFPRAKLICIARDPRDVLSSAWHFFPRPAADREAPAAKVAFIRSALPSLEQGARVTLALAERHAEDCAVVTYEGLLAAPEPIAARLFRFLGVSGSDDIVAACVARTSFAALAGGRPAGVLQEGSFFRRGVAGDWRATLTPEMNAIILEALGWSFPAFGWEP